MADNKIIPLYKELFIRYIDQMKEEISAYKDEADIWKLTGSINNSPGTLTLHMCGNLQHFVGAVIGNTEYVRNRDEEFAKKNASRNDLLTELEVTRNIVDAEFDNLDDDRLEEKFPSTHFGEDISYGYALSRLISHFAYHVGQINYHRRMENN
jgi:hypothetical protein